MKFKSNKCQGHKTFTFVRNNLDKTDLEVLVEYEMNMINCYIMALGIRNIKTLLLHLDNLTTSGMFFFSSSKHLLRGTDCGG